MSTSHLGPHVRRVDRIRTMQNSGFDLYDPRSAAAQLGISVSFFRDSVKKDPAALIVGRGMIACNTPALQEWWDGKAHHK